jgi:hypothetical protein
MLKDVGFTEGEPTPGPYRVMLNGVMQDGYYKTLEEARASVTRLDLNVEIWKGFKRVFGRPLPD